MVTDNSILERRRQDGGPEFVVTLATYGVLGQIETKSKSLFHKKQQEQQQKKRKKKTENKHKIILLFNQVRLKLSNITLDIFLKV